MAPANVTQTIEVTGDTRDPDTVIDEALAKASAILQVLLVTDTLEVHESNSIWAAADFVAEARAAYGIARKQWPVQPVLGVREEAA